MILLCLRIIMMAVTINSIAPKNKTILMMPAMIPAVAVLGSSDTTVVVSGLHSVSLGEDIATAQVMSGMRS